MGSEMCIRDSNEITESNGLFNFLNKLKTEEFKISKNFEYIKKRDNIKFLEDTMDQRSMQNMLELMNSFNFMERKSRMIDENTNTRFSWFSKMDKDFQQDEYREKVNNLPQKNLFNFGKRELHNFDNKDINIRKSSLSSNVVKNGISSRRFSTIKPKSENNNFSPSSSKGLSSNKKNNISDNGSILKLLAKQNNSDNNININQVNNLPTPIM